jgi:hypothetical protein
MFSDLFKGCLTIHRIFGWFSLPTRQAEREKAKLSLWGLYENLEGKRIRPFVEGKRKKEKGKIESLS